MPTQPALDIPPDVAVFCDPALKETIKSLAGLILAKTAAPIDVFSAPGPSMIQQLLRNTRDDVLITLSSTMDDALRAGLVQPQTRVDGWINALVLVAASATAGNTPGPRIAATDPTAASAWLDGRAILAANGLNASRVVGAANTRDVGFLVRTGAADSGLVYRTDAQADPGLRIIATLRADPALLRYSGALTMRAKSPKSQAFLDALRGPDGIASLRNAGLETGS